MFTVRLFCAAGMSTSLLVTNLRKAARGRGMEADIEAYPIDTMAKNLTAADVVLLGPQVAYMKRKAAKLCEEAGIPMSLIPMAIYGKMDGEKVLDFALELASGN
ncbi:MAG: PTS sugar transporter subunit IIB [Lachnospiraceae bacterium]|jgi:PTS system cellobiose-specific IIB component|nr:PTS sugar transporter subunit IIB [Lachnospiraceae bacterium]